MNKKDKSKLRKCRQQVAEEYATKIHQLQAENRRLHEMYDETRCQLLQAEDKIRSLEDWNERLKEYMDMTDEEFELLRSQTDGLHDTDKIVNKVVNSVFGSVILSDMMRYSK